MTTRELIRQIAYNAVSEFASKVKRCDVPLSNIVLPPNTVYFDPQEKRILVQVPPMVRHIGYYSDYLSTRDLHYLNEKGRWKGPTYVRGPCLNTELRHGFATIFIKNTFPYLLFDINYSFLSNKYCLNYNRPKVYFMSKPFESLQDNVNMVLLRNVGSSGDICYGYFDITSESFTKFISKIVNGFFQISFGYFLGGLPREDYIKSPTIWEEKTLEDPSFILKDLPGECTTLHFPKNRSLDCYSEQVRSLILPASVSAICGKVIDSFEKDIKKLETPPQIQHSVKIPTKRNTRRNRVDKEYLNELIKKIRKETDIKMREDTIIQ